MVFKLSYLPNNTQKIYQIRKVLYIIVSFSLLGFTILSFSLIDLLIDFFHSNFFSKNNYLLLCISTIASFILYIKFFIINMQRMKPNIPKKILLFLFYLSLYQCIVVLLTKNNVLMATIESSKKVLLLKETDNNGNNNSKIILNIFLYCYACIALEMICFLMLNVINLFINMKNKMTFNIYKQLKNIQMDIFRHSTMKKIEKKLGKISIKDFKKKLKEFYCKMKNYYTLIYLSFEYNSKKHFPIVTKSFFESWDDYDEENTIDFNFDSVLEKFKNTKDSKLEDKLTLGFFPSYFSFLVTEDGIANFLKIINELRDKNPDKIYKFSRVAFLSPFFIKFISKVFLPFSLNDNILSEEEIKSIIIKRWEAYAYLIPNFIINLLSKESLNQVELLSRGFFEIMFSDNSLIPIFKILGIFEFCDNLDKKMEKRFRELLKNEEFLKELIDKIPKQTQNSVFLSNEFQNHFSSEFDIILLSSIDIDAIQEKRSGFFSKIFYFFTNLLQNNNNNNNNLYTKTFYSRKKEDFNEKSVNEIRNKEKNENVALLKYLIQASDLIPEFAQNIFCNTNQSINEFVKNYLILRGEVSDIDNKIQIYKILKNNFCLINKEYLINCLKEIEKKKGKQNKRNNQISIVNTANIILINNYEDLKDVFEQAKTSFLYEIFNREKIKCDFETNEVISNSVDKFKYKAKRIFNSDYKQVGYMHLPIFYFYELIKNSSLPECKNTEDKEISQYIKNNAQINYDICIKDKQLFVEAISNINNNNEIKDIIEKAFLFSTHPIKKLKLLKKGFNLIDKISRPLFVNKEYGADDYTTIFIQTIYNINPYGLISYYQYNNNYFSDIHKNFDYIEYNYLKRIIDSYEESKMLDQTQIPPI